jgi:hypothetical protein
MPSPCTIARAHPSVTRPLPYSAPTLPAARFLHCQAVADRAPTPRSSCAYHHPFSSSCRVVTSSHPLSPFPPCFGKDPSSVTPPPPPLSRMRLAVQKHPNLLPTACTYLLSTAGHRSAFPHQNSRRTAPPPPPHGEPSPRFILP